MSSYQWSRPVSPLARSVPFVALVLVTAMNTSAQEPVAYSDGSRGEVIFPQGPRSFADRVGNQP